ncbi:pur operon repressor [Aneurinibacillus aneurinilyticus]|uniref:Pur operon repressor n=2 Tax=Aneurinibacillus aneurinilyticus TaxID=1391 RepID=A0A848D2C5_ANEAE|nr:pur operon repressor [Aneurinibacillus aneurinilyticus]ERI08775.1 pur operon repressor PurR [Aneurinibacillus aneurinilyticus ATCC 12856]MCI1695340.1 pur operon repressor [Aneurinibacillus aneurinilyticus]MED0671598.1 pur operon repressor [Aneurinibacillus aneurinilyticus]MED0706890.1 pur operon repressor [Aneurinibacillus aneurinilyticus]MED0723393.1 pur operon repressor [Aneurinibacillus aneurinilyticus]
MKKLRRSARLVDMTQHLLARPHKLIPLTFFAEQYGAAKSSISEDLSIIKELFESEGVGLLRTVAGAAGGVKYIPLTNIEDARRGMERLCRTLESSGRLLPGGYLYMADLLGDPEVLTEIGKVFATVFAESEADYVMTVETKGIPLAYATAYYLNIPVVIVRRYSKVTDGSVVSINYVSGSSKRIQTMSLARRSLPENSKVLIVDDFMKAGGTARGMMDLLEEFKAEVVGVGVFMETANVEERLVDDYVSLLRVTEVDVRDKEIRLELGNYFKNKE